MSTHLVSLSRIRSLAEAIVKQAMVLPPPPPAEPGLATPATGSWADILDLSADRNVEAPVTYGRSPSVYGRD